MTLRPLVFLQRQRPVMKRITRFALTVVLGFTAQLTQANQLEDNLHKFSEGSKSYQAGDYKTAVDIWRTQALLGFVMAQTMLGFVYAEGTGVTQNYQESAKWFRKAAVLGQAGAQHNLGVAYAHGRGIPQSNVVAYMLFNIAATNGNIDSLKNHDNLLY